MSAAEGVPAPEQHCSVLAAALAGGGRTVLQGPLGRTVAFPGTRSSLGLSVNCVTAGSALDVLPRALQRQSCSVTRWLVELGQELLPAPGT